MKLTLVFWFLITIFISIVIFFLIVTVFDLTLVYFNFFALIDCNNIDASSQSITFLILVPGNGENTFSLIDPRLAWSD